MAGPVPHHPKGTSGLGDQPDREHHRCHHDRSCLQHCDGQRPAAHPLGDVSNSLSESDLFGYNWSIFTIGSGL